MKLLKGVRNPNSLLAQVFQTYYLHIGKVVKHKEKTSIFYDERVHSSKENIDTLNFQKNAHICCLERGLIFLSSGFLEILLTQWMMGLLNSIYSNANSSKMGHVIKCECFIANCAYIEYSLFVHFFILLFPYLFFCRLGL